MTTPDLSDIARSFRFEGSLVQVRPHGCGHINDTYAAVFRTAAGTERRYLLQRINHVVFRNPGQVMANIEMVTRHLRDKIKASGGDPDRETMSLIQTVDGSSYCRCSEGDYWRAYILIEGARTYEGLDKLEYVYSASNAFGRFQSLLVDFPVEQLHESIPGFHDTPERVNALIQAVNRDTENRAHSAKAEIEFVERRMAETSLLVDLLQQQKLPRRVTHNDTKLNNVMIDDETGQGVCVIDLDTVMSGLSLYDFGDSVRTGAALAGEDEQDLSKVGLRVRAFEALVHGYLDATRHFLTPLEIDHLAFSARLLTLECGLRFLTDYLDGDIYFKTQREDHNLDRCRTQFKMVRDMERLSAEMEKIVERYRQIPERMMGDNDV